MWRPRGRWLDDPADLPDLFGNSLGEPAATDPQVAVLELIADVAAHRGGHRGDGICA